MVEVGDGEDKTPLFLDHFAVFVVLKSFVVPSRAFMEESRAKTKPIFVRFEARAIALLALPISEGLHDEGDSFPVFWVEVAFHRHF